MSVNMSAFRKEMREATGEPQPLTSEQSSEAPLLESPQNSIQITETDTTLTDKANATLTEVLHALLDATRKFSPDVTIDVKMMRGTYSLHIKLPPPMFFFIENGSPVLAALLGETRQGKLQKQKASETHAYRVRLCCASIFNPRFDYNTLWCLPVELVTSIFNKIIDAIAPENVVQLMQLFSKKCHSQKIKPVVIDIYTKCKNLNLQVIDQFFPNAQITNPYVEMAITQIVHEIGIKHDNEIEMAKMKAIAKSGMF